MYRLIVFDLDNTLAALGKGILPQDAALLHALEDKGARIAICSGKPTYYLCGFMRQLGLRAPVLAGENGAVIQLGVDLPPRDYFVAPCSADAKRSLLLLRAAFDEAVPHLWYQPNETALTPFPKDEREFSLLQGCIDRLMPQLKDIIIYRHCDSYDITPVGITKKSGLERLGSLLGIAPGETIAVGDGVNDYPMFEYAGLSVGVNVQDAARVDHNFASANQALCFLHDCMDETRG